MMKRGICYLCDEEEEIFEEHHLIPRSRGGKEGPTIDICVKCHKKSHYLAKSKTPLEAIENSKLKKVVKILRIAEGTRKHSETYKVNLEIPERLYNLIKEEAQIGKKRPIPRVILAILVKYFKDKVR